MRFHTTAIADVLIFEPKVFGDARGFFMESYNQRAFAEAARTEVVEFHDYAGLYHEIYNEAEPARSTVVNPFSEMVVPLALLT